MIRRQKTTIFLDAKETTTVNDVKRMVEGILKKSPDDQRLYKLTKDQPVLLEDSKQLSEYGFTHLTARAQLPEPIGLAFRIGDKEEFEQLEITPVSTPPDLPDVMKNDSTGTHTSVE